MERFMERSVKEGRERGRCSSGSGTGTSRDDDDGGDGGKVAREQV